MAMREPNDVSYWYLYIKKYLKDSDDPRFLDEEFMRDREDAAVETFCSNRNHGDSVNEAWEKSMQVLMADIDTP